MCHILLNDPGFFTLLLHIDRDLARLPDITMGAVNHSQSNIGDFYRELGVLDEKLYMDVFAQPAVPAPRRAAAPR